MLVYGCVSAPLCACAGVQVSFMLQKSKSPKEESNTKLVLSDRGRSKNYMVPEMFKPFGDIVCNF